MESQRNDSSNGISLGDKISNLSEDKKRYLKKLLLAKKSGTGNETTKNQSKRIQKRGGSITRIPCSQLQKEFWYRWNLFPENSADNIAGYVKLKGKLNVSFVERAFHDLVSRHEVLRSKFAYQDGGVFVEIEPGDRCDIKIIDLTELSEVKQSQSSEDIIEIMRKEASRPFNLSVGSLIRLRCFKVSANEWYLLMIQHHIVSDGTSTNILIRDMLHYIEQLSGTLTNNLPELSIQFYDYVMYQNEKLEKGEFDFQKEYWKNELKDCDMDLRLADSPYKSSDDLFGGGRVRFRVEKELNDKINLISRKYLVTPFSFLMTAFRTLLYRYTKQEDIVIVIPVQGRNEPEAEALIGCFLNMLPIRNRFNDGDSFIECVKRENKKILNALDHQDIPFGSILKELNIRSESMLTSVYHIVFSYEGNVMKDVTTGDFEIEFDELALNTTKSDLILELNQADHGLDGWFEYRTGRFSHQQIEMFKEAFHELLKNSVALESQTINDINLLTETEKELVLTFGADTEEKWKLKTINSMFSDIAAVQPEREALIYAGGSMSYGQLDRLSNKLARYLRSIGVKSETIVGLMVGKLAELFVGIMGVLKAGGAYLPIEPSYPEERIRYLMNDSGAKFLMFDEEFKGDLSFLPDVNAIKFTALELDNFSDDKLPDYNGTDSLAYIIYTSGTTGNPKGVMVEHRGVSNWASYFQKYYGMGPGDRVLQFSHIVFDACVWEMAISLLTGAGLCIVRKETLLDVPAFVKQVREFSVTVVDFSPQYWKQISREGLSFRLLLTAGSEADEAVVRSASKSEIYVNGYGPTENTVGITLWKRDNNADIPKKIPIGKPISNVQVYILDGDKMCGVGVTGEICVAGVGVARGYLNRPKLTAEKFTDNPFGSGKLYHTGDYGRWMENGEIEFAGRIDGQVKIRGYRVEAGEIESSLCKCEGVEAAAVTVTEDTSGETVLAAYVVLKTSLTVKKLDNHLNNILPFYMVPSRYYQIEEIPLNINGKTDYAALERQGVLLESGYEYTPPSTETERKLVAIWEELLKVPHIGVDDNFFECGGDSIIIMQVISKAAQEGINIGLKSFYQDKTIAKIAKNAVVASNTIARSENALGEYEPTPVQGSFFDWKLENPDYSNRSVLLALDKSMRAGEVNDALNIVLQHHDALRTHWDLGTEPPQPSISSYQYQKLLEEIELHGNDSQSRFDEICKQVQGSLSLNDGKLMCAALLRTEDSKCDKLMLTVHRLVCDEISLSIITEDLIYLLNAKKTNQQVTLSPKTTSYPVWSSEFNHYAHSKVSELNRQKWLEEDCSDVSLLPRDFPSGTNFEADAQKVSVRLSDKYMELLIEENFGKFKITAYELILSGFVSTLNKWSRSGGIIFLYNHERDLVLDDIDVSRTVGWFSFNYPFHFTDSFCKNGPGELMKAVKNKLFEASQKKHDFSACQQNNTHLPKTLTNVEVILNYIGKSVSVGTDDCVRISRTSGLCQNDSGNMRTCLIKVDIYNVGGSMTFHWTYSGKIYLNETIKALAESFASEITALIDYCLGSADDGITASDYNNSEIDSGDLEYILSKFG